MNNTGGGEEQGGADVFSGDQKDKGKEGDRGKEKEKDKGKFHRPQAAPTDDHTTRQGEGGTEKNNYTTSYTTTVHPSQPDNTDTSPQYYPTVNDAMVSLLYAFQEQTFLLSNTTFGPLHEAIVGDSHIYHLYAPSQ